MGFGSPNLPLRCASDAVSFWRHATLACYKPTAKQKNWTTKILFLFNPFRTIIELKQHTEQNNDDIIYVKFFAIIIFLILIREYKFGIATKMFTLATS